MSDTPASTAIIGANSPAYKPSIERPVQAPASGYRPPAWRLWLRRNDASVKKAGLWLFWFVWLFDGAVGAGREHANRANADTSTLLIVVAALALSASLVFVMWLAVSLSVRYPLRRRAPWRHWVVHVLAMSVSGAGLAAIQTVLSGLDVQLSQVQLSGDAALIWQVLNLLSLYPFLAIFGHAWFYVRETRRAERAALQLQAELVEAARRRTEAEVRALKTEMSPRFLSDALATIATLVPTNGAAAEASLARVGEVLSATLRRGATREVVLAEELEGIQPLIEVERARLSGMLTVDIEVEAEARDALVPDMILQPVLATLLSGAAANGVPQWLGVKARRDGGTLQLELRRSATGAINAPARRSGIDFVDRANVRSRLKQIYGDNVGLEIKETMRDGVVARLTVPWRDMESPPSQPPRWYGNTPPTTVDAENGESKVSWWRHPKTIKGTLVTLLATATWVWMYTAFAGTLDRVFGPGELPRWFVALVATISAAIIMLCIVSAYEMQKRVPWDDQSRSLRYRILAHTGVALALGLLHVVAKFAFMVMPGLLVTHDPRRMLYLVWQTFISPVGFYLTSSIVFFFILGAVRRFRAEREALRLRAKMAEAEHRRSLSELRALQAQLNPHFLGNALHMVGERIRSDPAEAVRVLHELRTLVELSMSRQSSGALEVTLAEELAALEPFVAIERARLGGGTALELRWRVDESALSAKVPHLILQPLVENAVRHGLAASRVEAGTGIEARGSEAGGCVEVAATRHNGTLELSVEDNGRGVSAELVARRSATGGVGLANLRARLEQHYGGAASLELLPREGGGTIARVSLPWKE